MADKNTIKNWFLTGLKPTQAQFWATWDSFWHKDEKIPITAIDDIENILAEKADAEVVDYHLTNEAAHANLFNAKEDKNKRGASDGYAPLNNFTKLAIEYLNVVNDLVTGGVDSLLTAEQGKLLQTQIDNINVLLTSDNVNLDNVQELVDAIETVQTSLETILVNDLTTGGATKALTAEMGKTLKGLIDALVATVGGKEDSSNKVQDIEANKTSTSFFASVKQTYDWCMSKFRTWDLGINTQAGITYTFALNDYKTITVFTNANPVALTIPTNASVPIPVGTAFTYTQQGYGVVTVGGSGITFVTNIPLASTQGETRCVTKIDVNTWVLEGNHKINRIENYLAKFDSEGVVKSIVRENSKGISLIDSIFNWGGNGHFLRLGSFSSISEATNGATVLMSAAYESGFNQYKYISTGKPACMVKLQDGNITYFSAPAGIIDDYVYFSKKLTVTENGKLLINTEDNNSSLLQLGGQISVMQYNVSDLNTAPLTATSQGKKGEIRFAEAHICLCIATDTWVRTALTTWE